MGIRNRSGVGFFDKVPEHEEFLEQLNDSLLELEAGIRDRAGASYPSIHVIGLPRSGTTLMTQAITASMRVGYINNLIAAFWKAPVCGVGLSQALARTHERPRLYSNYGRTESVWGPHEFGYFWSRILNVLELEEPTTKARLSVNLANLRIELDAICNAFRRPTVFKSFFLGWFADLLNQSLNSFGVVYVYRDPVECACSLLKMRRKTHRDENAWTSLKPLEYDWLKEQPYWVQVAGQVYFLKRVFEQRIDRIRDDRVLWVAYSDLITQPAETLAEVARFCGRLADEDLMDGCLDYDEIRPSHAQTKKDDWQRVSEAYSKFEHGEYSHIDWDRD